MHRAIMVTTGIGLILFAVVAFLNVMPLSRFHSSATWPLVFSANAAVLMAALNVVSLNRGRRLQRFAVTSACVNGLFLLVAALVSSWMLTDSFHCQVPLVPVTLAIFQTPLLLMLAFATAIDVWGRKPFGGAVEARVAGEPGA